jgi:hypothetical protein
MSRNPLVSPQTRLGCAAAAALASALVFSSVLWLFSGAESQAASATSSQTASATAGQVLVSADGRVDAQRARIR